MKSKREKPKLLYLVFAVFCLLFMLVTLYISVLTLQVIIWTDLMNVMIASLFVGQSCFILTLVMAYMLGHMITYTFYEDV